MVEKLRTGSLQPGATLIPLFKSSLLLTNQRVVPILTVDHQCIGYVSLKYLDCYRSLRTLKYGKFERIPVLMLKQSDTRSALDAVWNELISKKIINKQSDDDRVISCYPNENVNSVLNVPIRYASVFGLGTHRVSIIAFKETTGRNVTILMGRRISTLVTNPSKIQLILNEITSKPTITREELAEMAYKAIDFQPAFYTKLKSCGLVNQATIDDNFFINRTSYHQYEINLSEVGVMKPKADPTIESFEMLSFTDILELCHVGQVVKEDIPPLIQFGLTHGLITPETELDYYKLNALCSHDLRNPFIYKP